MAALIRLNEGVDWQTSGGLFDWTLEFLLERVDDVAARNRMRQIVDNNLGSLWLSEFTPAVRATVLRHLSAELVQVGERSLPPSDRRDGALAELRELATLAAACE